MRHRLISAPAILLLAVCMVAQLLLPSCAAMYDESMAAMVTKGAINNDLRVVMRNVTPSNVRLRDRHRVEEPVYFAASNGNREMINLLVNNGASLRYRSRQGKSLAYVAAAHGHHDVANQLVRHGGGTMSDIRTAEQHRKQQIAHDRQMAQAGLAIAAAILSGVMQGGGGSEERTCFCGAPSADSSGLCSVHVNWGS